MNIDTTDLILNIQALQQELSKLTKQITNELTPVLNTLAKTGLSNLNSELNNSNSTIKNFAKTTFESVAILGSFATGVNDLVDVGTKTGLPKIFTNISTIISGLGKSIFSFATSMPFLSAGIAGLAFVVGATFVGALMAEESQAAKNIKAIEKQTEAIKEQNTAYEEAAIKKEQQVLAGLTELDYYDRLFEELQTLVDINGMVMEGNEERVGFITSQLSAALGMEINFSGQQIENYDSLTQSYEKVMAQKKAMLILESQEAQYIDAIQNKDAALKAMTESQLRLDEIAIESEKLNNELLDAKLAGDIEEEARLQAKIGGLNQEKKAVQEHYNESVDAYDNYATTMTMYEDNFTKAQQGNFEEMSTSMDDYRKKTQESDAESIEDYQKLIDDTNQQLNILKDLKDKNNTDVYDADIAYYEKKLLAYSDSLKEQMEEQKEAQDEALEIQSENRNVILADENNFNCDKQTRRRNFRRRELEWEKANYAEQLALLDEALEVEYDRLVDQLENKEITEQEFFEKYEEAEKVRNEAKQALQDRYNVAAVADRRQASEEKIKELINARQKMADVEDQHNQEANKEQEDNYLTLEEMAKTNRDNLLATQIESNIALLTEIKSRSSEFLASGEDNMDSYASGMKSEKENVGLAGEAAVAAVKDKLDDLPTESATIGSNVMASLTKKLENTVLLGRLGKAASNLGITISSGTRGSLGIASPSKVMQEIGGFVVEGLQIGMKEEEESTLQQAQLFGENIINTMQDELNQSLDIPEVNKNILTDVVTDFSTSKYHNQTQSNLATLTGLLTKYLPYIAEHSSKDIVLNDRTLVGKLAPKIDVALADISLKKGRGM